MPLGKAVLGDSLLLHPAESHWDMYSMGNRSIAGPARG